jgi:hypothetical protein
MRNVTGCCLETLLNDYVNRVVSRTKNPERLQEARRLLTDAATDYALMNYGLRLCGLSVVNRAAYVALIHLYPDHTRLFQAIGLSRGNPHTHMIRKFVTGPWTNELVKEGYYRKLYDRCLREEKQRNNAGLYLDRAEKLAYRCRDEDRGILSQGKLPLHVLRHTTRCHVAKCAYTAGWVFLYGNEYTDKPVYQCEIPYFTEQEQKGRPYTFVRTFDEAYLASLQQAGASR